MTLPAPGRAACRYCGTPLGPHEAVKQVCAAPKCQMRRVQDASRAVFQRDWQSYVGRQRAAIEAAAGELGTAVARVGGLDNLPIGVVPRQERPIVPQPEDRRAAFAEHLDQIIVKAFEEGAPDPDLITVERGEGGEAPLIDATCATCQGKCCILGGASFAFLTSNNIQRFRLRNPGTTPAAAKAHYLGLLPDESVEHSCLYHGPKGCVISRADRADICNAYHCNPQTQLLKRMREMGADRAVIVAHEGKAGPAIASWSADGGWQPVEPQPGAVPDLAAVDAAMAQIPPDLPERKDAPNKVPTCDWCGQPIDPHRAASTRCCGRDACEKQRLEQISARVERDKHERYVAKQRKVIAASEKALARAAGALGTSRDALVIGVVPHQNRPVEPAPTERLAAFEAHLKALAVEGFAISDPENYHNPRDRAVIDPDEEPIADACCATCQGSCCRLGGESFAFLNKYDVCRYRLTFDDPTPEGFVAHYLGRLPERSVREACLYQTDRGCNLARTERASLCNTFQCKGLKMLVEAYKGGGGDRAVILSHRDTVPKAVGVFEAASGWRPFEPNPVVED